jgi:hypothetical protein
MGYSTLRPMLIGILLLALATYPEAAMAAPANAGLVDWATEVAEFAETAADEEACAQAWLAYEQRHWEFFQAMLYGPDDSDAERRHHAAELAPRRAQLAATIRQVVAAAPQLVQEQRRRVGDLVGVPADATVYLVGALGYTNARADLYHDRPSILLNAWHGTLKPPVGLGTAVAHELIHNAEAARLGWEAINRLPPAARSLFNEGLAVFGVSTLFPAAAPNVVLMYSSDQLAAATRTTSIAAAALRDLLNNPKASREQVDRFFRGGIADPVLPPRTGYYLGWRIFQAIAANWGPKAAMRLDPNAFVAEADRILADLASP